jgi:hypothetical protein
MHVLKHKLARQDNGGRLQLEEGASGEDLDGGGGRRAVWT